MAEFLIAPASRAAAKHAVESWHYSRIMPHGKLFIRGLWENGSFRGVVVFGRGASPFMAGAWGMKQTECVELVRVAMRTHETPITQVVARALRDLRTANPGLRMVVSFADPAHAHHGGIYQAGNWIYTGRSEAAFAFRVHGRTMHPRSVGAVGWRQSLPWLREHVDPAAERVTLETKHRYVYPLDRAMRRRLAPLALP